MNVLTIEDYIKIINARWKNSNARQKLVLKNHGNGHFSVKLEKSDFEKELLKNKLK